MWWINCSSGVKANGVIDLSNWTETASGPLALSGSAFSVLCSNPCVSGSSVCACLCAIWLVHCPVGSSKGLPNLPVVDSSFVAWVSYGMVVPKPAHYSSNCEIGLLSLFGDLLVAIGDIARCFPPVHVVVLLEVDDQWFVGSIQLHVDLYTESSDGKCTETVPTLVLPSIADAHV